MTSISSAAEQALILQQLLQQQQLQQAADARATTTAQLNTATQSSPAAPAPTVNATAQPTVGGALGAALSELGSKQSDTGAAAAGDRDTKLAKVVQAYSDLGPSDGQPIEQPS